MHERLGFFARDSVGDELLHFSERRDFVASSFSVDHCVVCVPAGPDLRGVDMFRGLCS